MMFAQYLSNKVCSVVAFVRFIGYTNDRDCWQKTRVEDIRDFLFLFKSLCKKTGKTENDFS